ncbi:protein DDI1 homolog 2 isoform X2 [Rhinatrema bivittatum]|uniref:protein DDI1 homolog 2 isoform X2 n=1 Tax=Rhinatrema bivittatum TaxID=194408 RepID=UPI00112E22B7|nr:protein DDI1 homolog 2 isoform X2 [Rhinatrema bivittatum]
MLVTVYCVRRDLSEITFSLEVDADFELQNFRALCELESGIPAAESQIIYAEVPLTDSHRSLASYGLKDGDVVILRQKENADARPAASFPGLPAIDFSSIAVPGASRRQSAQACRSSPSAASSSSASPQGLDNPAMLREMLLSNPHELSLLKERNPPLADALLSGDLEKFIRVLLDQQQERARREQERIRLFSADPFDLEAQAKIEEDIRQQNIEENMTIAMEEAPESFGQVVMLYINCKVNGYPVKAFVDSGAQMTIMSQACAERCHIMRLVDKRWAGIAKGVGTQKIIGRVHLAQVQIEGDFLPCSFSILEEQPMDMLLGLDMLKRHQCSIDLKMNVLLIGTTGTQTTFLPEGELPECARLAYGPGREDMQPEDIADQELAEVLQKSAEEAGNRERESTSLDMPSLPPTDGLSRSTAPSGLGSEICNPPDHLLDRSVSAPASVCSHKSSLTENVEPEVVGPLVTPTEYIASPEKEKCSFPLQGPSEHPSSIDNDTTSVQMRSSSFHSPIIASQNTSEEPISVEDAHVCEPCTGETQEGGSSLAAASMPAVVLGEELTCCKHLEFSPLDELSLDPQLHGEPVNKQFVQKLESGDIKHPGMLGNLELHAEENHDIQKESLVNLLKGSMHRDEQKMDLPPLEEVAPALTFFNKDIEILMDLDRGKDRLTEMHDLAGEQNTKDSCGVGLNSDCSEMEIMESGFSLPEAGSQEISSGCLTQSENNIEMTRTETESSRLPSENHHSPFTASPDKRPLKLEPIEEPCLSLAAALKELHKLLIVSGSGTSTNLPEEVISSPDIDFDDQTKITEFAEKNAKNEPLNVDPASLNPRASLLEEVSELECLNACEFQVPPSCLDIMRNGDTKQLEHSQATVVKETQKMPGPDHQDDTTVAETSHQNHTPCTSLPSDSESPARDPYLLQQSSEQDDLSASRSTLNQGFLPQGIQKAETHMSEAADAAPQPKSWRPELEGSQSSPVNQPGLSLAEPSPVFPITAVRQILSAGFSLQEAHEALQQADGNVDLALLSLLAKNIVVPT